MTAGGMDFFALEIWAENALLTSPVLPESQLALAFQFLDYPLLLGRDILEHYQVDVRRRVDQDEPDERELEEE